jgi:hypothetical protein
MTLPSDCVGSLSIVVTLQRNAPPGSKGHLLWCRCNAGIGSQPATHP